MRGKRFEKKIEVNEHKQESSCRDEQRLSPHALILVHFPEGEGQFMHVSSFSVTSHKMYAKVYENRLLLDCCSLRQPMAQEYVYIKG